MAQARTRPAIDALVDGFLLVTPEQDRALRKLVDDRTVSPPLFEPPPMGIPVLVVSSNKPVTLPSGRVAVNALGDIYILPGEPTWPTPTSKS